MKSNLSKNVFLASPTSFNKIYSDLNNSNQLRFIKVSHYQSNYLSYLEFTFKICVQGQYRHKKEKKVRIYLIKIIEFERDNGKSNKSNNKK